MTTPKTAIIPLQHLHDHPGNANSMPKRTFRTLVAHLREGGCYPPLIVRPHAAIAGEYELLDGHHRARALRKLGVTDARCDVWHDVDDDRATMLLLTLNRLQGSDDPRKRGELLQQLCGPAGVEAFLNRLPEDRKRAARLMELSRAQAPIPKATAIIANQLHAVTFFLTREQRDALNARLHSVDSDRTTALLMLAGVVGSVDSCAEHCA